MKPTAAFVRSVLHGLKKLYADEVDVYSLDTTEFNTKTGKTTVVKTRYRIRRAIVLDADQLRKFSYDLTFIAANKSFSYGGHYDINEKGFIIDRADLPRGFVFQQRYIIAHEGERYETKEIKDYGGAAWLIIGKHQAGATADLGANLSVSSTLSLGQTHGEVVE